MSALVQVLGQQKITINNLPKSMHEQGSRRSTPHSRVWGGDEKNIELAVSCRSLQNHQAARKIYQKGTCRWLIDSPEFTQWIKTKNSGIWLYVSLELARPSYRPL